MMARRETQRQKRMAEREALLQAGCTDEIDLLDEVIEPFNETVECPSETDSVLVPETEKITQFYRNCFKHIQQRACRNLACAWIHAIHPRKSVECPYNGAKAARDAEELAGASGQAIGVHGGELTRPKWWPPNQVHRRGPHHMKTGGTYRLIEGNSSLMLFQHAWISFFISCIFQQDGSGVSKTCEMHPTRQPTSTFEILTPGFGLIGSMLLE